MDARLTGTHRTEISNGLSAAPIVSIATPVPNFFSVAAGGVYPNSESTDNVGPWATELPDPLNRRWQRFCSMEYLPNGTGGAGFQINAGLSVTGGSSLSQYVTRKHNLRVTFDAAYGPESLSYQLFPDTTVQKFTSLHLKQPTHDSWAQNTDGWQALADGASFCDEGWIRQAHLSMGHDGPRRRWVHLFINGIYWGPHEFTERVDEEFMQAHGGTDERYDVLKQPTPSPNTGEPELEIPEPVDGDLVAWTELMNRCLALKNVEPLLSGEAARWGYLRSDSLPAKTTPYQKSDWLSVTNHITGTWLPQRQSYFLSHAAQQNLYVNITPTALPNGKVGTAYSQALSATGGAAPRTFAIAAGPLPAGLSLSGSTLSGTPTMGGATSFKITATSADGITGITELTITVAP